ncbi:hypothetical protein NDU88_010202 [Pleurodeles waltl]|uniref:Uncharacterized protein n=1 Tax=Pleurodeles waltl TaxID=8319 RepID=A0AAV7RXG5_PLEWA|nr:hypothetical protein NDU88_010202 [Pleurodeles waltl]
MSESTYGVEIWGYVEAVTLTKAENKFIRAPLKFTKLPVYLSATIWYQEQFPRDFKEDTVTPCDSVAPLYLRRSVTADKLNCRPPLETVAQTGEIKSRCQERRSLRLRDSDALQKRRAAVKLDRRYALRLCRPAPQDAHCGSVSRRTKRLTN